MNQSTEERQKRVNEIVDKLKLFGLPYYVYTLEQVKK